MLQISMNLKIVMALIGKNSRPNQIHLICLMIMNQKCSDNQRKVVCESQSLKEVLYTSIVELRLDELTNLHSLFEINQLGSTMFT